MTFRNLGDYTVLKQIGQGALGTVYLAEHRFMKKQYALKVLPEELSTNKLFIRRFEEEIAGIVSLDHPHIVKIHNISYAEGIYFLVMDCIVDAMGETTNFARYMAGAEHPIREDDLLRWTEQMAGALDYAREGPSDKAIFHRGLKPNNILLGKGVSGKTDIYLTDFGLSKIIGTGGVLSRIYYSLIRSLDIHPVVMNPTTGEEQYPANSPDSEKLKRVHASFLQSYAFLAPEQKNIGEKSEEVRFCDTYAFGVFIYFAVTGKFPEGVFDMPSTFAPQYKKNWDALVTACLRTDPEKRPKGLVAAMEELLERKGGTKAFVSSFSLMESAEERKRETPPAEEKEEVKTLSEKIFEKTPPPVRRESVVSASVGSSNEGVKLRPFIQEGEIARPQYEPDPGAVFNIDTTVTHYQPKKKEEIVNVEPLLTDMVVIKGGTFHRGSKNGNRDEMPRHRIHLNGFALDIHPVTNEQFLRFLEAMGGEKDSQNNDIIRLKESRIKRSGGRLGIESGYAKHPVVGVSWYGAVAYSKWIGKRLPSEAEWEVAACGNIEDAIYPTGFEIEKHQANFFSSDTTSVMSYPPNDYGLYDMAGNVYEWCQDWYGYNYYDASAMEPDQPEGPLQGVYRVLRGGCWKSLREDLRCSHRHRNNPGCENRTYGFRCATDVK